MISAVEPLTFVMRGVVTVLIVLAVWGLGLAALYLLFGVLRRLLLRPMKHTPTDTTDAWAEAGRRLKIEPEDDDRPGPGEASS